MNRARLEELLRERGRVEETQPWLTSEREADALAAVSAVKADEMEDANKILAAAGNGDASKKVAKAAASAASN